MGIERCVARARAALEATERLLRAPFDREVNSVDRAELGRHLGELRRLLDALDGDAAQARRGDPAADRHEVGPV